MEKDVERFNPGLGSKTRTQALGIFGPLIKEAAKIHSFENQLSGKRLVVQSFKLQEESQLLKESQALFASRCVWVEMRIYELDWPSQSNLRICG